MPTVYYLRDVRGLTLEYMTCIIGSDAIKKLVLDNEGCISGEITRGALSKALEAFARMRRMNSLLAVAEYSKSNSNPDEKVFLIVDPTEDGVLF